MQAQVLDIQHREIPRLEDLHHLAQRRRAGPGEDALLDPRLQLRREVAADRVDQPAAAAAQGAPGDMAKPQVIVDADVLEHADRDEGIVVAADVAVIVLDVFDAAGQALAHGPFARIGDLLARDVEGAHLDPVVAGHVQGERAPAAAGLDHGLARAAGAACGRHGPSSRPAPHPGWLQESGSRRTCRPWCGPATTNRTGCRCRSGDGCCRASPPACYGAGGAGRRWPAAAASPACCW